jgi:hypothetical protein
MRILRSHNYFTRSHGKCRKTEDCKFKAPLSGDVFCQDRVGEYSDYCEFYEKPLCIGKLSWTTTGLKNWLEVKKIYKESRNACFVLPVIMLNGRYAIGKIKDFENTTLGIKAVMYTTNEQIAKVYGTKQGYYSYSFLRKVFKKEIAEME